MKDSFSLPTGKAIGYDTKSTKTELQKESNALSGYGYNIQDTDPSLYEHLFKLHELRRFHVTDDVFESVKLHCHFINIPGSTLQFLSILHSFPVWT